MEFPLLVAYAPTGSHTSVRDNCIVMSALDNTALLLKRRKESIYSS